MTYKMKKKNALTALLFLLPSLLGVSIFILIPFTDVIRRSFSPPLSNHFAGFDNFEVVIANGAFQLAIKNTCRFVFLFIPLLLVISLFITLIVNHMKKKREFIKVVLLVPIAIPAASTVLLWKMFFHDNGIINLILHSFGAGSIDFMNSGNAFYMLIIIYLWKYIGYNMVLWLSGLANIPESYYEAAKMDGGGPIVCFFYITLPELRPTIYIASILALINSLRAFREVYLIQGNYPQESIYMLQHLFNNWFLSLDINRVCAGAVLMAAVIMVIILLLNLLTRNKD